MTPIGNVTATTVSSSPYEFSPFLGGELFALTLSAVIAVLLTFVVQNYLNQPKIRGSVFNVLAGEWSNPVMGIHKTAFWPYVYLTNYHQNAIYPLDYEFEVDFGEGYVRLDRVYGDLDKILPEVMSFTNLADGKEEIQIRNLGKHALYKTAKPVQYGDFLHGLVMFAGAIELHKKTMRTVRFTCIDVFGKRHTIEADLKKFLNWNLFLELLGVSV